MCITPFQLKERDKVTGEFVQVPCGKCPDCLARLISGWSFRLVQEGKDADSALFVTLTYNTDSVPLTRAGYMTLQKADVQKFMKRLRFAHTGAKPIRYFAVGEYGGKTMRPHYHLILFNSDYASIMTAWENRDGRPLGNTFFGYDCSEAAIGYTLKYMMKPGKIPLHRNDDRVPEFRLMSKGLGANYLKKV